MSFH
jgi:hypothetical protein